MAELERLWYNGESNRYIHYDTSRYHGLNLHSVFSKGTIEFRLFNSTLHAGEVKAYIQLCLAISHQALVQKSASRCQTHSDNEKYTFRTWLLRLGMIGDEFKTARQHLLKHLEGQHRLEGSGPGPAAKGTAGSQAGSGVGIACPFCCSAGTPGRNPGGADGSAGNAIVKEKIYNER